MRGEIFLRRATDSDIDILFQWANDALTRANSFSTHQISYEEHCAWFKNILSDETQLQFILMHEAEPVGQVRLTIFDDKANISYSVNPSKRGLGYGKILCKIVIEEVRENYPNIRKLCAQVKPTNDASIHCFTENGFAHAYNQYEYIVAD